MKELKTIGTIVVVIATFIFFGSCWPEKYYVVKDNMGFWSIHQKTGLFVDIEIDSCFFSKSEAEDKCRNFWMKPQEPLHDLKETRTEVKP